MIDQLYKLLNDFIKNLTPGHFEGMFLYLCGAISMTWVQVVNRHEIKEGLKGENKLWESPEWIIYLWSWLFPHVVLAVLFLGYNPPAYFWYFFGIMGMYGLLGKYAFEWILAWRHGGKSKE